MCRMMGVAARGKMSPLWFDDFHKLAEKGAFLPDLGKGHDDGWGVAGYLGNWTVHFGRSKEGASKEAAAFTAAAGKAVQSGSKILMAHLRKASAGELKLENSHPFIHYGWIFSHNGTLHNAEKLENPRYSYEGSTDSERFFKFLIDRLYRKPSRMHPAIIRETVAEVKQLCTPTSLTFLLSSGSHLIAYRDYSCDESYYTLQYTAAAGAFLVCSEELPGFEWVAMKNGELIMVDRNGGDRYELL